MAASGAAATPQAEPPRAVASPTLDEQTLTDLRATFPSATGVLDRMAELLAGLATDGAQAEFRTRLKEFAQLTGTPDGDGETDPSAEPGMLRDDHTTLFERFRDALRSTGAQLPDGEGGQAAIGDSLRGSWTGAKEALRQATYWQMKNRAGVVGRRGLAPLIGELHQASPELRVPLVGHSFGARLVSNALAGLPDSSPSPLGSLTLLQGAFSHFAFADPLPFDAGRHGALAGLQRRGGGAGGAFFFTPPSPGGPPFPLASPSSGGDPARA